MANNALLRSAFTATSTTSCFASQVVVDSDVYVQTNLDGRALVTVFLDGQIGTSTSASTIVFPSGYFPRPNKAYFFVAPGVVNDATGGVVMARLALDGTLTIGRRGANPVAFVSGKESGYYPFSFSYPRIF